MEILAVYFTENYSIVLLFYTKQVQLLKDFQLF